MRLDPHTLAHAYREAAAWHDQQAEGDASAHRASAVHFRELAEQAIPKVQRKVTVSVDGEDTIVIDGDLEHDWSGGCAAGEWLMFSDGTLVAIYFDQSQDYYGQWRMELVHVAPGTTAKVTKTDTTDPVCEIEGDLRWCAYTAYDPRRNVMHVVPEDPDWAEGVSEWGFVVWRNGRTEFGDRLR